MNTADYTISELKEYLKEVDVDNKLIQLLASDSRKGVQKLARKYIRIKKKQEELVEKWESMNKFQEKLKIDGYDFAAGIDEAGRGPLAGPVVAAAVILDTDFRLLGIDDSKKLSPKVRNQLYDKIKENAIALATGIIDNNIIDKVNIHNATFMAMKQALEKLECTPDFVLVDGNKKIPDLNIRQKAIIDGDSKVNAIAAASIVAKVTRDRIIDQYHKKYPEYGFLNNKGYGTEEHINALEKFGPTPIHRYSFSVVAQNAHIGENDKFAQ